MAHPQDYIARSDPLQPELLYNRRANPFRLLLRASFALPDKSFLPKTFFAIAELLVVVTSVDEL